MAAIDGQAPAPVTVPGLVGDPAKPAPGPVWYRRSVTLPEGTWTHATLRLKGARFCPQVHVNDVRVAGAEGGMAPIELALAHPALVPGARVELAIRLASLDEVPRTDASRIPDADLWRSSVASYLWDGVSLRLHGAGRITRVVPRSRMAGDSLEVGVWFRDCERVALVEVAVEAADGRVLAEARSLPVASPEGAVRLRLALEGRCARWSPESPVCHRLRVSLLDESGRVVDERRQTWGHREVTVDGRRLLLNGAPLRLRGHSVVWHRWCRDPEARTLAWDKAWFDRNLVRRLKDAGANFLRAHLGLLPEAYHDLCDQAGLGVQGEWIAFHGMPSSRESLRVQWEAWMDALLRHPSTLVLHPWNETDEEHLAVARGVVDELEREGPVLPVGHRDILHVHKYWWSLFENLGCYYDHADDFPLPVIADEFGGNYLDYDGAPGGYPTVRESLLRFLGPAHTREDRLRHQAEANARVAEYWRRLDVAGFAAFCALGSPADGNTHFLGPLAEARPKPVWAALGAAFAPVSVSVDAWDRNYEPGERVVWPLVLFNDQPAAAALSVRWGLRSETGDDWLDGEEAVFELPAHGLQAVPAGFRLPAVVGAWRLAAVLTTRPGVESAWRVRTVAPVPALEFPLRIDADEAELAEQFGGGAGDAEVWVGSRALWRRLADGSALAELEEWLESGRHVVILDAGPVGLGQPGPLDASPSLDAPASETHRLPLGARANFVQMPEPESCFHLTEAGRFLGQGLPEDLGCLWNGLRGGLTVPAWSIDIEGLGPEAFLELWRSRGADPAAIRAGACVAYQLAGFHAFAAGDDPATEAALRERVRFLATDAPALQHCLNPAGKVARLDLGAAYRRCNGGGAAAVVSLARAGKDLARDVVLRVDFGRGRGRLFLSQLITAGRLGGEHPEAALAERNPHYRLRRDPVARRLVHNLVRGAVQGRE